MKQGKYAFAILMVILFSLGLSSCYVGYYGGRGRGYYNRGPHHHRYPGHHGHPGQYHYNYR